MTSAQVLSTKKRFSVTINEGTENVTYSTHYPARNIINNLITNSAGNLIPGRLLWPTRIELNTILQNQPEPTI